jgi:hypothetical protein
MRTKRSKTDLNAVLKLVHGRLPELPRNTAGDALEMVQAPEETSVKPAPAANGEHSYLSADGYARLYRIVERLIDASPEQLAYNDEVAAAAVQGLAPTDLQAIVQDWLEGRGNAGVLV